MPLLEFHAINPLTYLGPALGLNLYLILIHIPIVFGFGVAAHYIIRYLRKFYGDRPIPGEWKFFWLAMIWGTIHELIETLILYQWIIGQILLIAFFVVQIVAGSYLLIGSYLLAKRYSVK